MGTTDPGYVGVGMGPGARLGFVGKLLQKTYIFKFFQNIFRARSARGQKNVLDLTN
jgi:hypothetical protein